jgi:kynurenine formamidase
MRLMRIQVYALLGLSPLFAATLRAQQDNALSRVFDEIRSGRIEVVDLTHPLDDQSPYWPEGQAASPFHASVAATFEKDGYFARLITMPEHFGTHMDAPAHFDAKGLTVDRVPPRKFLAPAVVIDVSLEVEANQDYRVRREDIEKWEKENGKFPPGAVILIRTGWGARWPSQKDYMNQDAQGVLHFPGLSVEAAQYLLASAHPVAIGIDTPSIDYGPSKNFEVHHITMSAGLYHLENLIHLGALPARGAYVIALPLAFAGGSGSPARVLALVRK